MRAFLKSRKLNRGSAMVMFTLMLPAVIIPLVGLGIDVTMLYIVQAKLSAAVDAAALGGGRLLGTNANISEITGEFITANFREKKAGFWGANNLTPSVTVTLGVTNKIHIEASVDVPLIFSRVFGQPIATVKASGESTRRDSRLMVVIDRSGSMTKDDGTGTMVITDVINYSKGFVQKFSNGVDELGLVVFDAGGVVGYPTVRPWDSTITKTSTGGPDSNFMSGSSTDMVHQIGAVTANGGTGMAEGLWLAYMELQKAHLKDQAIPANNGVDNRLNSILLFTDGVPSALSMFLNNTAANENAIKAASACLNKTTPANPMNGFYVINGSPPYSGNGGNGIYNPYTADTTDTAQWWMNHPYQTNNPSTTSGNFTGCTGITNPNIVSSTLTDLGKIPNHDLWGADMTGNRYTNSHIVNGGTTSVYNGTDLNNTKVTDDYHWGLAMWNGVDSTATRIRTDVNQGGRAGDAQNMSIAIYVIGYTGNGGVDDGLLKRIANDKAAAGYDATQPTGRYIPAADKNALANAFDTMASIILRLSQ